MGLLITLVIVEAIIIFLLLKRPAKTITIFKDAEKEEQLKYQEIYNLKTRELDKHLSEEKEKSVNLIHAAELESLVKIGEKEQALAAQIRERENNISSEIRLKESNLAKEYEELKTRLSVEHQQFMELKNTEFAKQLEEIENNISNKSNAAAQQIVEYQKAIET